MREGIYLIAATNRPEMIDEALLRPGRLETRLYVQLPKPKERVEILRALLRQRNVIHADLAYFAEKEECSNFSGADLEALLRRAGQSALRRGSEVVQEVDFLEAARGIQPSVGNINDYERMRERYETR
jgi:ribosome biogenesis ATPase